MISPARSKRTPIKAAPAPPSIRPRICSSFGKHVEVDSRIGSLHLRVVPRFVDPADVVTPGSLLAPMPGTVIGVPLEAGAEVTAGQTVLVLEAMKMQHTIRAPADGLLSELVVAMGQQVSAGEVLAVVTDPEKAHPEQAHPEQAHPEGDPS